MTTSQSYTSGWKGHLLALLSGALYPLGLAPLSLWPLILLSIGLFYQLLDQQTTRNALLRGWLYGLGHYGVGVSWVYVSIHYYGHTPVWLAIFMTGCFAAGLALFFAGFAYSYCKLNLDRMPVIAFTALWLIFDWIKTWAFSGFPWLFPGYGFIDTPLKHAAPIGGVFLVSALAIAIACLLSHLSDARLRNKALLATSLIACTVLAMSTHQWTTPSADQKLAVALVQGNIPQEKKWDPAERDNIFAVYLSNTDRLWQQDLIVWPEAALPVFYQDAADTMALVDIKATETHTALITGTPFFEYQGDQIRYYNSVVGLGDGSGVYHKQKLVPFGEYVPLEQLIRGLIPFFDLPLSSFSRGADNQQPLQAKNFRLAPFICYEIVYPELVRHLSTQADALLTISNDAWFGHSFGPHQHFEIARMRALEHGKYLLRATNTGITAIVDPQGHTQAQLEQFKENVLTGVIHKMEGSTPFARWGSSPLLVLAALTCLIGAITFRSRDPKPS